MNEAQPDGTRPIHWAVYRVDYELIDALIAKKAKVDVTNEFGSTPLAEAVKLADARMVKMLLDAGAGVEGANQDGQTALMLAIKTGELPIVEMLVKAGANVNTVEKFQNQTPLMWAAAAPKNAGEMTKLLLSKGANVKARALYTDWPNQISSEPRGQYRPVGGLTALLYAARNGCYDCVEALIGAGADVNVPTPEGVTPLMVALDNDHNDVAKLLLDRGANPHVADWWGRTALYIAIDRKESVAAAEEAGGGGRGVPQVLAAATPAVSSMDIINRLLAADVDVNAELNMLRPSRGGNSGRFGPEQLNTGCTPLYRATEAGDMEVIRALLAKGANPNINDMGFTPFLVAAGVTPGGRGGGRRCAEYHASGSDDPTRRRCECSGHRHENLLHADLLQHSRGQRRYVGSPRSGAGGPDGPGSLPSGEGSQSRARRCQRQEADRSAQRRRGWRQWRSDEVEAELQHLLPPQEPEVVAALGVEASARRLQPRFARCCKTRRRRSSPSEFTAIGARGICRR